MAKNPVNPADLIKFTLMQIFGRYSDLHSAGIKCYISVIFNSHATNVIFNSHATNRKQNYDYQLVTTLSVAGQKQI